MIEIYDKDSILFMTPLSRQDEFYVEETEEEEDDRVNSTLEESEKEGSELNLLNFKQISN